VKSAQQNLQDAEFCGLETMPDLDDKQFKQWVQLLEERTGTILPPERKSFLVTNLGLRMREIGCNSYEEYYELINSGIAGIQEWTVFVDRITVHETRFFRHPSSLELVREEVLNKQPGKEGAPVSIQAWSAACATGEEAYTLAIVIDEALGQRNEESYFGVLATDISQASLSTGRKAVYGERRLANVNKETMGTYLSPAGKGQYQVCEDLRKRVCFARMNILDIGHEPIGKMDIIYCQNLLIYFDKEMRMEIVNSMAGHLSPGGLLILGSGELVGWDHPEMEKVSCNHTLAYRRRDGEV
jgi:chemotaxis protein methyltransferase CheR/type IV pilus assembly protein PilK